MAATDSLVYVGPSPIHGEGVFAAVDLDAGQLIGHYEGEIVTRDGTYVLWIEEEENVWTGYEGVNRLRYLNHSEAPNAEMYGLACYAVTCIPAGVEITIDYGWQET